jgi:hypothetical protein
MISLAAMVRFLFLYDRKDVVLAQNDVFFAVEFDFGPQVLADEHYVAHHDRGRLQPAILEELAASDGDNARFEWLLLGGIGDEEAAGGLAFVSESFRQYAIMKWTDIHETPPLLIVGLLGASALRLRRTIRFTTRVARRETSRGFAL